MSPRVSVGRQKVPESGDCCNLIGSADIPAGPEKLYGNSPYGGVGGTVWHGRLL